MSLPADQKQFIMQYMQQRDVPAWQRGLSPFQIEAADQLSHAIRDDIEQNTTHRLRQILTSLGLSQGVCTKDLAIVMRLSGGNDLAFLWFLMELNFKTKGNKYSSLNEQIVLSCIAHLDMVTTLRELDRILPPGHPSKRQLELRQKKQQKKEPKRKLVKKRSSPYFDKLTVPKKFGKSLTLERPDYKVRFLRYDAYKDPTYVPPNELSRWYDHHVFRRNERVTTVTLREYMAEILKAIGFSSQHKHREPATSIIDLALEFDDKKAKKEAEILCMHHRREGEQRELRRRRFEVKQRQNCLNRLELFGGRKKTQIKRMREMLEKEAEMYRLHYRKMNTSHAEGQSCIRLLGKQEYAEHCFEDNINDGNNCFANSRCAATPSTLTVKNFNQNSTAMRHSMEGLMMSKGNRLSFQQTTSLSNFDYHYFNTTTPASSERYFVRPTENKPFRFDYAKIFQYKNASDKKYFIREKCVEAMDKEPHDAPKAVDLTPDLAKVAKNCANEVWLKNEKKWRATEDAKEREEIINPTDPYPADMPRLPFYDCEDRDLMDRMLQSALREMQKHPKFVLASLPDAYKMPMLREWISQRYGKRYTQAQQMQERNMSMRIMHTLQSLKLRIRLPKSSAIGLKLHQNYGCYKYIMKKINLHRRYFYDRLSAELLKRTRYFWFAMRSSLCLLPQSETFFAYMPSRLVDNYLFKPWQLGEYMDAKAVFEKRRIIEAQKSTY